MDIIEIKVHLTNFVAQKIASLYFCIQEAVDKEVWEYGMQVFVSQCANTRSDVNVPQSH